LKSLKVKILDKEDQEKEILGHYFYPKADGEIKKLFTIPQKIFKTFKSQKLTVALKESKCGFWEKNFFKTEISMIHFLGANEIVKSCKVDGIGKFEVIVRIR